MAGATIGARLRSARWRRGWRDRIMIQQSWSQHTKVSIHIRALQTFEGAHTSWRLHRHCRWASARIGFWCTKCLNWVLSTIKGKQTLARICQTYLLFSSLSSLTTVSCRTLFRLSSTTSTHDHTPSPLLLVTSSISRPLRLLYMYLILRVYMDFPSMVFMEQWIYLSDWFKWRISVLLEIFL